MRIEVLKKESALAEHGLTRDALLSTKLSDLPQFFLK